MFTANSFRWTIRAGLILALVLSLMAGAAQAEGAEERGALALSPFSDEMKLLITEGSILELQAAMSRGPLSAQALTRYCLEQIEMRNAELNAVISVNPAALEMARRLDAERNAGKVRGPLHGIPILIKDNMETRELPTTAGSLALKDNHTGRDAMVVARLREAGAIILGKANLSEWANFRSVRSSSGWSAMGGQTRNPHDPTRSPSGSSSGSGAAVAAGLAVAALGTETIGSVVSPASVNGVVGIKPSVGLVSRTGIVPISHTLDTAGPMARNVADAAVLLSVMAGLDPADGTTEAGTAYFDRDFVPAVEGNRLQGGRIGIVRSSTGLHEGVDALLEQAIADLKRGGAIIVDDLRLEPYDEFRRDTLEVLLYEFKHNLNAYLAHLPNELNTLNLAGLIRFNEEHAFEEMPYFRQELFEQSQSKGPLTEEAYRNALVRIRRATREEGIDRLLRTHELDALIAPTFDPAWTIDPINGDHYTGGGFAAYPAVAGYPHVTVPMGKANGLPVGLSFAGPAFSERKLIALAVGYEQIAQKFQNR